MVEQAFNYKHFSGTLLIHLPRKKYDKVKWEIKTRNGQSKFFNDYPSANKEFMEYRKKCEELDELIDTEE